MRDYYREVFAKAMGLLFGLRDSFAMLIILIIALLIVFNQGIGARVSEQYQGFDPKWSAAVLLLGILCALIRSNHIVARNKLKALADLRKKLEPKLAIFVDPTMYYGEEIYIDENNNPRVKPYQMLRVIVKNTSMTTIDGVRVFLEKLLPHAGNLGVEPLRYFLDVQSEESNRGKRLDPGNQALVGVVFKYKSDNDLRISYAKIFLVNSIPLEAQYVCTLMASGSNVSPVIQDFDISWSGSHLTIEPSTNALLAS